MPGCVSRSVPLPEAFAPNKKLDCLRSSAAWEAFLDYLDQFETVDRLWDNAMSFNATSILGFFGVLRAAASSRLQVAPPLRCRRPQA